MVWKLCEKEAQDGTAQITQGILFAPDLNGFSAVNLGDRFSLVPTD